MRGSFGYYSCFEMPNYYNRFLQSAARWPDAIALEVQHSGSSNPGAPRRGHTGPVTDKAAAVQYTYAELKRLSACIGQWLNLQTPMLPRGSGPDGQELKPRVNCAILAANSPRWVATFLGILAAGGTAVPLDAALNPEQLEKLLLASDSSFLFVDNRHLAAAERATAGSPIHLVSMDSSGPLTSGITLDAIFACPAESFRPAETDSQDVAAILYSSGTTGDPKGVMLTHDNMLAETEGILEVFRVGPADAILGILPLFHALALVTNLLLPLAAGARVLFLESLNTTELLQALPKVNIFVCVPQFFYLIHERLWKEVRARGRTAELAFHVMLRLARAGRWFHLNLGKFFFRKVHRMLGPEMRYLATGGSRFDTQIGREFEDMGFTMLQGYGLTETTGCATYTPPEKVNIASVGMPLPGVEIDIINPRPRDGGPPAGEIAIRGRIVMKGYYRRPEATAAVLQDGWLRTGDLGYRDRHGNLVITGREKEVIVLSSGKNIYPEEIEAHYLKSPLIKEIAVLGLEGRPGEPPGERLHAVVVPNFELLRQKKIVNSREALRFEIENLSNQLPSVKRILSYDIWQQELPRTTTRKLKRFEIQRRVLAARHGAAELAPQAPVRELSEADREWLALPEVARAMRIIADAVRKPLAGAAGPGNGAPIHPNDNLELDLGLDSMQRVELLVALEHQLGAHPPESVLAEVYTVRELVDAVRNASLPAADLHAARPGWDAVLRGEAQDPAVLAITQSRPVATAFWFLLTRAVYLAARVLFRLEVRGREKLPNNGPFILSANHQSYLDPPVLISILPWRIFRDAFYVGTSEIFGTGILRRIARSLNLVPVDPDLNLVPAMRAGAYGLRHSKVLVLYPEGERSIDGTPKTFKKGAAILASHLNVPICPVALDGFHEAWPRGRRFQKFSRLRIAIGDPIMPSVPGPNAEKAYDELTRRLRDRVVEMWYELHDEIHSGQSRPK